MVWIYGRWYPDDMQGRDNSNLSEIDLPLPRFEPAVYQAAVFEADGLPVDHLASVTTSSSV